jgi:plastocyanin
MCALAALFAFGPSEAEAQAGGCPPIADKPDATPHVEYEGMEELTYCVRAEVEPGQNIIRLAGTDLFPNEPGYITRFDPELVYADGSVPRVDVLHLHHAVWIVDPQPGPGGPPGGPQFATGEEKTIVQAPEGFGWRTEPTHNWLLNDMLHDLVAAPAEVYIVWRIDFVPDDAPGADEIRQVRTRWMDVVGGIYPVFDSLRGMGEGGRYTFPDDATGADRDLVGQSQKWTVQTPSTLIGTAGHLHPGGLNTTLRVTRGSTTRTLFTSRAHYFEPAGPVSWDVAMGATTEGWRVRVQPGDEVSVHTTYDVSQADWYEGMGIMPVMVYPGTDVGGEDALSANIPQAEELTHGHLAENDHHGGGSTGLPNPSLLPSAPAPSGPVEIDDFLYEPGDLASSFVNPPTVRPGQSLDFLNQDAGPAENAFHTITSCKAPCNSSTGIAYPIANGPVSFDSGQLGFNSPSPPYAGFGAPAADRDAWTAPDNLKQGTYNYFCRIHPFMRGSFRVAKPKCQGVRVDLLGTQGKDKRKGTKDQNGIVGLDGRDKLLGRKGKDALCGGGGKDTLKGGPGDDKINGGPGKDKCRGGGGDDKLTNCER